jgi:hypothetical protein
MIDEAGYDFRLVRSKATSMGRLWHMRSEERKQTGLVLSAVISIDAIAYFGRLIERMDSIHGSNQIT